MLHFVRNEGSRRLRWILILIMPALSGCAIHYTDHQKGVEHLWGLGQLGLTVEPISNNLVRVTSGSRVPGVCIGIGHDHIGLSLGYIIRERLVVVETNTVTEPLRLDRSHAISRRNDADSVWGLGHLRLTSIPSTTRHQAIITGKALAGLAAHVGGGDTSLSVGLDGRQRLAMVGQNIGLEFDQDATRWPGFDFFAMRVESSAPEKPNQHIDKGEP